MGVPASWTQVTPPQAPRLPERARRRIIPEQDNSNEEERAQAAQNSPQKELIDKVCCDFLANTERIANEYVLAIKARVEVGDLYDSCVVAYEWEITRCMLRLSLAIVYEIILAFSRGITIEHAIIVEVQRETEPWLRRMIWWLTRRQRAHEREQDPSVTYPVQGVDLRPGDRMNQGDASMALKAQQFQLFVTKFHIAHYLEDMRKEQNGEGSAMMMAVVDEWISDIKDGIKESIPYQLMTDWTNESVIMQAFTADFDVDVFRWLAIKLQLLIPDLVSRDVPWYGMYLPIESIQNSMPPAPWESLQC